MSYPGQVFEDPEYYEDSEADWADVEPEPEVAHEPEAPKAPKSSKPRHKKATAAAAGGT